MNSSGQIQSGGLASTQTARPPGATELIYRRSFEGAESPGKLAAAQAGGSETILLVEDTVWLRELIRRGLGTFGYTVLEAADGEAAIALAGTHPGPIHLLVSDLLLPGIGGRLLAERLGALKPGIKQLYISGYSADAALRHNVLGPEAAFLQKPFTPDTLAGKVREVLGRDHLRAAGPQPT